MVARQDSPMGSGPSDSGSRDPERGGRPATRRPERGRAARFLAFRHPRWTAVLGWFSRRSARSSPSLGPPPRCSGRDLPPHDRPRLPVGGEEPRLARSTGRLARLRSRPWSTLTTQLTKHRDRDPKRLQAGLGKRRKHHLSSNSIVVAAPEAASRLIALAPEALVLHFAGHRLGPLAPGPSLSCRTPSDEAAAVVRLHEARQVDHANHASSARTSAELRTNVLKVGPSNHAATGRSPQKLHFPGPIPASPAPPRIVG
jgi:hypothetical protein